MRSHEEITHGVTSNTVNFKVKPKDRLHLFPTSPSWNTSTWIVVAYTTMIVGNKHKQPKARPKDNEKKTTKTDKVYTPHRTKEKNNNNNTT